MLNKYLLLLLALFPCAVFAQNDTVHKAADVDEVVISGTLKPVSRANSIVPIEVYSAAFLRQNPTPSLFDALQTANGIRPQLNCSVCGTGDIHINGMEGPYTQILIDGMPIVSALGTVYGLNAIPSAMIQRIEVVKGPAATLYGSEAVGGLINIITRSPKLAPRLSADMMLSSHGEIQADVAASHTVGRVSSLLSASGFQFGQRRDVNADNFTDIPLISRISLLGKWELERPENRAASLMVRYLTENRFGGDMGWTTQQRGGDSLYGESIRTRRWEVLGKYALPLREKITLSVSYNAHLQNSVYGTTWYLAQQHIGFGQLLWDKSLGERHSLLAGAALRYTYLDDNTPATASENDILLNQPNITPLPGVFIQDEIVLNEHHKLLAGIRADYHPVHGKVLSPRLNYQWKPATHHTVRLSAGNGYRVANIFSEDHAALTGARRVVVSRQLQPEQSWNVNANYATMFFPKFGYVGVDASIFYTYFSNKIIADYFTQPDAILYDNLRGYGVSRGITLNLDGNTTSGITFNAGITLLDVFSRQRDSAGALQRVPQLHASPFSATWNISYTFSRLKLRFDYTGNVYSPMFLPVLPNDFRPEKSPWFSLQNVQLSRKWGNWELYSGIKNLLNFLPQNPLMRPFDPFDRQITQNNPNNYTFDTAYGYAPLQGIRSFIGFRWTWQ